MTLTCTNCTEKVHSVTNIMGVLCIKTRPSPDFKF